METPTIHRRSSRWAQLKKRVLVGALGVALAAPLALVIPTAAEADTTYYRRGPFTTNSACIAAMEKRAQIAGNEVFGCVYQGPPASANYPVGYYFYSTK